MNYLVIRVDEKTPKAVFKTVIQMFMEYGYEAYEHGENVYYACSNLAEDISDVTVLQVKENEE